MGSVCKLDLIFSFLATLGVKLDARLRVMADRVNP